MVPLFALLAVVGCNSEPTEDLRGEPSQLVATPSQLFLEVGQTKEVIVGAVDQQGNPLDFNYEVTATGTGISVRRDSSFLPIFVNDSTLQAPATAARFKFLVTGSAYTSTSFTVSAGGLERQIPVQVVPQQGFAGTFDKPTPVLGDTITLTAAPGTVFAEDAELRLPGVPDTVPLHPVIVARGEGGSSLSFIAPPNVNGPLIITAVTSTSAPGLVFSPSTDQVLQTPLIDTVDVNYSAASAALGTPITVTIPEPLIKVSTPLTLQFEGEIPGPAGGAANETALPDSSGFTFETPANVAGSGTVVNFVFPGGFQIGLPTRPTFTSTTTFETVQNFGISNAAPDAFESITITAPAGFFFASTVGVNIGGNAALVQSVAGDGSSVTVLPFPGSAGAPELVGVSPTGFPQFQYTMNATTSVTVGPALEGTESPETAPTLAIPSSTTDGGGFAGDFLGFHTRWYKIEVGAATTINITLDWPTGEDLGAYVTTDPADAAGIVGVADAGGDGAHPETSGPVDLAPGTYYIGILNFSETNPPFFTLDIN
ncbi:MAG TPA: PPC domain-containing protein [Gemmatimonadales bacterium]